ncbi:MAG TPA: thioesterase family protein [Chitinophagaceae bacterium]|nr:thioesterase family protein [Chitinophagaceae bacterium]HPI55598.1 thioesterase family protein [Chitinophagaceae bacterium]
MRIRIAFPTPFVFETNISVRIGDINYGGHVGNDSILSILHEARLRFLKQWNFTEMNAGGYGLIMADSAIQYKGEAFHGDDLKVEIAISNQSSISFDLYYKVTTNRDHQTTNIVFAKTGMISFDYTERKIVSMSDELVSKLFGS